jgi:hypothetical protein
MTTDEEKAVAALAADMREAKTDIGWIKWVMVLLASGQFATFLALFVLQVH